MPQGRKPAVDPGKRREWLRLYEEEGWTPPQIAKKDHYDVRTVRQYLETESQEKQRKQATLMVYRDALQAHYADLSKLATDVDASVKNGESVTFSPETNPIVIALREHTRRTRLWAKIDGWNAHLLKISEFESSMRTQIRKAVEKDPQIRGLPVSNSEALLESLADVLAVQVGKKARDFMPLTINVNFIFEPGEGNLVIPRYGAFRFGQMIPESAEILKNIINKYESKMLKSETMAEVVQFFKEKEKLSSNLSEDLSYIIHRRVVTGKCRYCPW